MAKKLENVNYCLVYKRGNVKGCEDLCYMGAAIPHSECIIAELVLRPCRSKMKQTRTSYKEKGGKV